MCELQTTLANRDRTRTRQKQAIEADVSNVSDSTRVGRTNMDLERLLTGRNDATGGAGAGAACSTHSG